MRRRGGNRSAGSPSPPPPPCEQKTGAPLLPYRRRSLSNLPLSSSLPPSTGPPDDPAPTSDLLAFFNVRRLHGNALSSAKADYTASVPGDARLFAGPAAPGGGGAGPPPSTSGPDTAIAPLAAARAGLGPPVPGAGAAPSDHLDGGGLRAALATLARGQGGGGGPLLSEADRGGVLGGEGK